MIEQLSVQYGVKDSCVALRVSRSGFYRWKNGQESHRAREQKELAQKIEQVFEAHAQRYGSPRVTRVLRQEGLRVSKNRVARLMRQPLRYATPPANQQKTLLFLHTLHRVHSVHYEVEQNLLELNMVA
jgi:hypothetical protein